MDDNNTRISDRYNRIVVSLAVLADDDPDWRPDHYQEELWGWSVRMGWPPLKLLDYANRAGDLEQSKNPFVHVVLVHLKALETRQNPEDRRTWKFRLVRGSYERGFSNEDVRRLFKVIDWLMELPPGAKQRFDEELNEYEEGRLPRQERGYFSFPNSCLGTPSAKLCFARLPKQEFREDAFPNRSLGTRIKSQYMRAVAMTNLRCPLVTSRVIL